MRNNEIKNETDDIKKWEEKTKRKAVIYKANKYKYDPQQSETIRSFGESIYTSKFTLDEAEEDQSNLFKNMVEFNMKSRPKHRKGKEKNKYFWYCKFFVCRSRITY